MGKFQITADQFAKRLATIERQQEKELPTEDATPEARRLRAEVLMHDELAQLGMDGDEIDALFKRYRAGEGGVIVSDRDGTEEGAALAAAEQAEAKGASYFAGKEVGLKWGATARESDLAGLRRFWHERRDSDSGVAFLPDVASKLYFHLHPEGTIDDAAAFWAALGVSDEQQDDRPFVFGFSNGAGEAIMKRL